MTIQWYFNVPTPVSQIRLVEFPDDDDDNDDDVSSDLVDNGLWLDDIANERTDE